MSNKFIAVGLGLNITNMEGHFVIKSIQGDSVVIYSIETAKEETRPLSDIELAVNAGSHSIVDIPTSLIQKSIVDKHAALKLQLAKLEEEMVAIKTQMYDLKQLEMDCDRYEREKERQAQNDQ